MKQLTADHVTWRASPTYQFCSQALKGKDFADTSVFLPILLVRVCLNADPIEYYYYLATILPKEGHMTTETTSPHDITYIIDI